MTLASDVAFSIVKVVKLSKAYPIKNINIETHKVENSTDS